MLLRIFPGVLVAELEQDQLPVVVLLPEPEEEQPRVMGAFGGVEFSWGVGVVDQLEPPIVDLGLSPQVLVEWNRLHGSLLVQGHMGLE